MGRGTMLRGANLVVHVYVDEDDDGTTYIDALMFGTDDNRLLGRGEARLAQQEQRPGPQDNRRAAAAALSDLVQRLIHDQPSPAALTTSIIDARSGVEG